MPKNKELLIERANNLFKKLTSYQQEDGAWRLPGIDKNNFIATASAVCALQSAGVENWNKEKALEFLLRYFKVNSEDYLKTFRENIESDKILKEEEKESLRGLLTPIENLPSGYPWRSRVEIIDASYILPGIYCIQPDAKELELGKENIFQTQDPQGSFLGADRNWITARIIIGLIDIGVSPQNEIIKKAISYLWRKYEKDNHTFQPEDSHLSKRGVYITVLTALLKSKIARDDKRLSECINYLRTDFKERGHLLSPHGVFGYAEVIALYGDDFSNYELEIIIKKMEEVNFQEVRIAKVFGIEHTLLHLAKAILNK